MTAFGAGLSGLPSWLPEVGPAGVGDRTTPRWAVRSDGDKGYLFLAWHQPYERLDPLPGVQFEIASREGSGGGAITVPSEPVTVEPGTLAAWPLFQEYGGIVVEWITATPVTLLAGSRAPVLVLIAARGLPVELRVAAGVAVSAEAGLAEGSGGTYRLTPSEVPVRLVSASGALDLLVLPAGVGAELWVREYPERTLLLSGREISWGGEGAVQVVAAGEVPRVRRYEPDRGCFMPVALQPAPGVGRSGVARVELVRAAGEVPDGYGQREGRASSPLPSELERLAGIYRVVLPEWVRGGGVEGRLRITWAGDVAELVVDGVTVSDRFWDGSSWTVDLRDTGLGTAEDVVLRVLPLSAESRVWLSPEAQALRASHSGQLLQTPTITVEELVTYNG